MARFAVFGNSGSGKSTLAAWLAARLGAPTLDLDTIAWLSDQPGVRRDHAAATVDLGAFCSAPAWIVEGCYGELIAASLRFEPTLVFLNPGLARCQANCRERPWEPHKYASKAAQDANLDFLLSWGADYYERDDAMSLVGHRACFDAYQGAKAEVTSTLDLTNPPAAITAYL